LAEVGIWLHFVVGIAIIAPALVVTERLNPEVPVKRISADQRTAWAYLVVLALWLPISALMLSALIGIVATRPLLRIGDLSHIYALQAAGVIMVAEFVAYWIHRIEHTYSALWRVHAPHHAARDVNWMTSFRFHPVDAALQQIAPSLAAVAMGFAPVALAPYLVLVGVVTLFAHCNLATCGPTWLDRIIATPRYHRSHHEQERSGSNFAVSMPILDVLFKTASFEGGERNFGTTTPIPESGIWNQFRWGLGLSKQQQAQ
jgi:sterol desaturase/sphingolipid hydroxylase (fatty acid hydroxylase superfamily)